MTLIEGRPGNRDRITKTRDFPQETIQKLENSIKNVKEAMEKQFNKKRQNS